MLHMKNDFNKKIQGFIKDLEDASPNIKNTLTEIYPVTFKLNIQGHKDIYISLERDVKAISFRPEEKIDFDNSLNIKINDSFHHVSSNVAKHLLIKIIK